MSQLIQAIKNNSIKKIQDLLDNGTDIHYNNDEPLLCAANKGNLKMVKLLLDNGADIHADDDEALMRATDNDNLEIVKLLLDNGADIHANNDEALILAADNGNLEIAQLLLDRGANIHAADGEALMLAVYNDNLEMVKLLLDRGANIHTRNDEALILAVEKKYLNIAELLLDRGANIHAKNDKSLLIAVRKGYLEMVKLFLDKGADIHSRNDSILQVASDAKKLDMVQLLLDRGATITDLLKEFINSFTPEIQLLLKNKIKNLRNTVVPLIAPTDVNSIKNKITQEIIENSNHICNIGNDWEGVEPIDPILMNPIPSNLIVSVQIIGIPDKNVCFNARNLWDYWISQTKNNIISNRYANNPLNMQYFTAQSIIYVQELLVKVGEEEGENFKIIKDIALYEKILKMNYTQLRKKLNKLNDKTIDLFPNMQVNENDDVVINVYRVAVLDKLREEGLI